MQAIERIRTAMYHESDDLEFACNPAAMTEVLAHIDTLEAENERLRKDAERKPMTGEQITKLLDRVRMKWASSPPSHELVPEFVRSVEAFHGITGGKT